MHTIDRHVTGMFIRSYLVLLLAGIGLYIFADILANLDEFTENTKLSLTGVLLAMWDYYGHNLPLYYSQLGGVMLAIAATFTFAIMLQGNEMTALVAAGVPLQRLAVPVLLASMVGVGLWAANSELIVPQMAHKIARRPDDLSDKRSIEVHCVRDDRGAILSATELHSQQGWLKGVHVIEPDESGQPSYMIRADWAQYDPQRSTWQLTNGARLTMSQVLGDSELGVAVRWEPVQECAFTLAPEQILLRQSAEWADLMSVRQMNELLKSRNLPNLPTISKNRDIRFTQPLLALILILLALPYFLTREPGNVLVAGGKALLLTGSCFAATFIAHSLPPDYVPPRLATALPVLVFGPLAVVHFANVKT
jgi:lipopolysaccharide export system permease protein